MRLLFALATVVAVACNHTEPAAPGGPAARQASSIDGPSAKSLVAGGAVLVDVRTPEEYAGGHVDGARNLPVDTLGNHLAELPRDKPIVVYCAAGARAARAARLLASAGYDARDLGGIGNWPR